MHRAESTGIAQNDNIRDRQVSLGGLHHSKKDYNFLAGFLFSQRPTLESRPHFSTLRHEFFKVGRACAG